MASAIISNDGFRLIKPKRKKNWTDPQEMEAFLNVWDEYAIQLASLKRNLPIYYKMSYKMANLGFQRNPTELRKKLSNVICKYKNEKAHRTDWPYYERVHETYAKMKKQQQNKDKICNQFITIEECSPEKSRNEPQKIVFISSGSNNVCIDETDMETILKAMNGEDISNKNDELSAAALTICEPVIEHSDTDHAETGNNESRSNDSTSERPLQISNVQGNASQDHQASNRCFTSILTPKKKDDVKLPQPRTEEKIFPTTSKVPEQTVEFKTCNCKKDEIDLYAALLATKLRTLDQKSRHVAMNKIDNMIFKIKMEHYEGQQRPQNVAAHQKSLPANPNAKE